MPQIFRVITIGWILLLTCWGACYFCPSEQVVILRCFCPSTVFDAASEEWRRAGDSRCWTPPPAAGQGEAHRLNLVSSFISDRPSGRLPRHGPTLPVGSCCPPPSPRASSGHLHLFSLPVHGKNAASSLTGMCPSRSSVYQLFYCVLVGTAFPQSPLAATGAGGGPLASPGVGVFSIVPGPGLC